MSEKLAKQCPKCNTIMRLIACPDGDKKWQCQNPKCLYSKLTGKYPK